MRDELLVKRYEMPERAGLLFTPAADHRTKLFGSDRTQTLWEVIVSNPAAEEAMGMVIPVGSIVQTVRRFPRDTYLNDADGNACLLLSVEACGVRGVITYSTEEEANVS